MPDSKGTSSFQSFLDNDRERQKNQNLAQMLLGKKGNNKGATKSQHTPMSGAITKSRSTSRSSRHGNQSPIGNLSANVKKPPNRFPNVASGNRQQQSTADAKSFSIRGLASQTTVIAQNFAPGTTAADVSQAMAPLASDGLTSCRLLVSSPTVIAELVFDNKEAADQVIATFNNQEADGHLLYVYMKQPLQQNMQPRTHSNSNNGSQPRPQPRLNNGYRNTQSDHDGEHRGRGNVSGLASDDIFHDYLQLPSRRDRGDYYY